MNTRTIACVVALALFSGCGDAHTPVATEPASEPALVFATAHLSTPDAFLEEGLSEEQRDYITHQNIAVMQAVYAVFADAGTWRDADRQLRSMLEAPPESLADAPAYLLEQNASVYMLRTLLDADDRGADALEAIGFYTQLLANHRTPEGALLVRALQALDGHWEADAIAGAAARGVEGVTRFLERTYYCAECPGKRGAGAVVHNEAVRDGEDVFLIQQQDALGDLEALSTP